MGRTRLIRLLCIPYLLVVVGVPVLLAALAPLLQPEGSRYASAWLLACAGVGGALALAISLWNALRVKREVEQMSDAMAAMTAAPGPSDGARRVAPLAIRELDLLASRINSFADERDLRFTEAVTRLTEREAVLMSMVEGVLAVDSQHRVLNVNPAAARFFGINPTAARDRDLLEVVRNTDLRRFISKALESADPVEGDIVIFDPGERSLRAHGSPLRDLQGRNIGAVIVLNDVTALLRLENVRRDFVANVSHELKTPVTSIKGFVETLQGGAMHDPADAERFLTIIARQADRLNAIIEDLLNLSRIERDAEAGDIALEEGRLKPVIQAAIQICEVQASSKNVHIELDCDPNLTAPISAPLLEQAIVNLIDNAVKYSPAGAHVRVEARMQSDQIVVQVQDSGPGIEEKHQPRLFERFYRVDKARSRKLGGTGLGLAIVKHIAQAHGGQVRVESELGRGSTFFLQIPKRPLLPQAAHA